MHHRFAASAFIEASANGLVLDVRSPGEFAQGHIPGSVSFPLFSDEERKTVGTLYKQVGQQDAILEGLKIVGPKLAGFVQEALLLAPAKKIYLYCWRGGMRSGSMAWLLEMAGFEVITLQGGYKAFRNLVLGEVPRLPKILVIAGFTGTGKTAVLKELMAKGESVVDLEFIACHRGSAFGRMDGEVQPTQEQFENNLHLELKRHENQQRVWVEDESLRIGDLHLPPALFKQIRQANAIFLDMKKEQRIEELVKLYGAKPADQLIAGFKRIAKRLGGLRLKNAVNAIQNGALPLAASIALEYYDGLYLADYQSRLPESSSTIEVSGLTPAQICDQLLARVAV